MPRVLHAMHAPRLARSGPVAESVQGGGDRGVAAHLRQLSNQIDRGPIRSHASLTRTVTRHAQLRMHAALPVKMENVFAVGLIGIDDDLVEHRAQDPFLQLVRNLARPAASGANREPRSHCDHRPLLSHRPSN